MNTNPSFLRRFIQRALIVLSFFGTAEMGWGQITETFSSWTSKTTYTAALSQSGSGGTWTALAGHAIVSPTAVASGTGSVGLVQLASSGILVLPNVASGGVGIVTIQARFSAANWGFSIEKNVNGGGWTNVQSFSSSLTQATALNIKQR